MKTGVVFPQIEFGNDIAALRDYAQTVETLGYTHILAYDHVLGANTSTRPDWRGPYTTADPFHEVFVLFGFLAAITTRVELVTGVIVLPQRQTALVAKQAAEVDVLSGGRFRLGVGVGWNAVEYAALGEDFDNRGKRSEEQIALLRELWAQPAVSFDGQWHSVDNAGINPLPMRQSIPIWIGGGAEVTLKRIARIGDGWFPQRPPDDTARAELARLRDYTHAAGRDPARVGIEARLSLSQTERGAWASYADDWRNLGATHLTVNTMRCGFASPQQHIDALREVAVELGLGG